MRGGKRGRTQRRHFKEARENVWKRTKTEASSDVQSPSEPQNHWQNLVTHSDAFNEYYKEQRIVPEEEWDEFISFLQTPLPATFRINSSGQFSTDILEQLENEFLPALTAEDPSGNIVEQMMLLPWYPKKLAWHLNYSRAQLRKNQALERFHEFLKQENETGNITRQEAVSMVPPLFLDVQSNHYILDMCAAPGSKTFQLLEMIHKHDKLASLPEGMVIANDVDVQRCNLLIHQTKRMCSANLIVTNHEAQQFPSCHNKDKDWTAFSRGDKPTESTDEGSLSQLLFDRILCDVPCSGDGTIRKAPDIWRKWNAGLGNGVHRLQVQIAMRGVSLLKVGGRLVYSTCSMNPVEDEAVVAEILRQSRGSMELLDVSAELPDLKRHPGIKRWKVRDRGQWILSYKQVERHRRSTIIPSMFPSGTSLSDENVSDVSQSLLKEDSVTHKAIDGDLVKESNENAASLKSDDHGALSTDMDGMLLGSNGVEEHTGDIEESSFPLERCMRILPHDQNTGAFFIAVFKKVSDFTVENNKSSQVKKKFSGGNNKNQNPVRSNNATAAGSDHILTEVDDGASKSKLAEDDANILPNEKEKQIGEKFCESNLGTVSTIDSVVGEGIHDSEETDKSKVASSIDNNVATKTNTETNSKNQFDKKKPQQPSRWRGIDPVLFFTDEGTISSIREFYGIVESFPLSGHLVVRNSEIVHVKRIYYISSTVRDALKLNFQAGQQLKVASVGLKIFERQTVKEGSSQCMYRISSEGLPLLLPHLRRQIVNVPLVDFQRLLSRRSVNFKTFQDSRVQEEASELIAGCCVIVLCKDDDPKSFILASDTTPIAVGCWKGKSSITLMVSKPESEELLERLVFKYGNHIPKEKDLEENPTHENADELNNNEENID